MFRTIMTKDAAAMLRHALKTEFPGVKFSVRMATGTASTWIDISYTDGPPSRDVDQVAARHQGTQEITADGHAETVRFSVSGVNTHRAYSPAAYLHAQALLNAAGHPEIRLCDTVGKPLHDGPVPDFVRIDGQIYHDFSDPFVLAQKIFRRRDLRSI